MADLQVDIVTPQRLVFSGQASEVRAPGWEGQFDILPGHTLYLSLLHGGVLELVTGSSSQRFVVGRGFAEAGPDRVTILTDRCVDADHVDKAQAQKDLAEFEAELMTINAHDTLVLDKLEEKLEVARGMLEI